MATGLRISFTAIRSNVRYLKTGQLAKELHKYTKEWCRELIAEVREYPAELLVPSYRRTHNLERSWRVVKARGTSGIAYEIQNMVRDKYGRFYARLVHGGPRGDGQWSFHEDHGWIKLYDALDTIGGRESFRSSVQYRFTKYAT